MKGTGHDALVTRACNNLIANHYTGLKADVDPYERPDRIYWESNGDGHIPDTTATAKDGVFCIFEIETPDTIDIEHTEKQLVLFNAYAHEHKGRAYLVVPNSAGAQAKACIARLNLDYTSVWAI